MGSIFSGNFKRKRRPLVEQCYRSAVWAQIGADNCPYCLRGVKYVYALPTPPLVFKCRQCLGLGYASSYKQQIERKAARRAAIGPRVKRENAKVEARRQRPLVGRRPTMELEPEAAESK